MALNVDPGGGAVLRVRRRESCVTAASGEVQCRLSPDNNNHHRLEFQQVTAFAAGGCCRKATVVAARIRVRITNGL
jgi:hypothetical protein